MLRMTGAGVTFLYLCQDLSKNWAFRNLLGKTEDCTESQETKIGVVTGILVKDIGTVCLMCIWFLCGWIHVFVFL